MEITFEKRTYNIKDGDDVYELVEIIKHPYTLITNIKIFKPLLLGVFLCLDY
jgi:hypothetical protein